MATQLWGAILPAYLYGIYQSQNRHVHAGLWSC